MTLMIWRLLEQEARGNGGVKDAGNNWGKPKKFVSLGPQHLGDSRQGYHVGLSGHTQDTQSKGWVVDDFSPVICLLRSGARLHPSRAGVGKPWPMSTIGYTT